MKSYGLNELRKKYLEFFESKGHLALPSFSLVPENDKSLLLINAGMAPLKPYFTGQEIPPRTRVTTCQKCIRTGDIENVGKTARHGTYFEMLGNFSFGDYFKKEAISWAWEYVTQVLKLPKDRLYISVYEDDDEAEKIWHEDAGVPMDHIVRMGKEDNFWEAGTDGPCGPCSEIYFDRGEKYGCGKPDCKVGCDCDRYMEFWNLVFTQFERHEDGTYTPLKQKNIDTGMGLERLASIMQDVDSIFDVDTVKAIRDHVCKIAGCEYGKEYKKDVSIRVITDHIRSSTFLISDGVMPSNEGRGYVLRRIIRRAAMHGRTLGIQGAFLGKIAQVVIDESKDGYPELEERKDFILKVLTQEEEKFAKTIDQGLGILADMEEHMKADGVKVLSGEDAFKLYDTYGFPVDLTAEILEEKGFTYDEAGFESCMEAQRQKARGARKETNYMGADANVYNDIDSEITTEFTGYDKLTDTAEIAFLTTSDDVVEALSDGDKGSVIVPNTPFYATMGGQQGDKGIIKTESGTFVVEDTVKVVGNRYAHVGYVSEGMIRTGEKATLSVDTKTRTNTCRNHSATHLLQKALREVLGTHVEQAGSYQDAERTRFDFSHFSAMTAEELKRVEDIVNEKINEAIEVHTDIMTVDEAKKTGAMALFGEKYGEKVRVVSMGDFSKEFCGGTHVKNTSDIKVFKILSESGVAAGVRRIEAITGDNVFAYYSNMEKELEEAAKVVKSTPANLKERLEHLMAEMKALQSENESLKSKAAKDALGDVMDQVVDVNGIKLLATSVDGVDMNGLRDLGDSIKEKLGEGVIVLASSNEGKVNLVAMATDAAIKSGAHAGNLIKAIASKVGGGGGGRPNMAQAGGKNPAGIPDAIASVKDALSGMIK